MVKNILGDLLSSKESKSVGEQIEIIISDLQDAPDKVFVWQFPDLSNEEMEELYEEEIEPIVTHGMKSQHIFVSAEVDIEALIEKDENIVRARDMIFEEVEDD